MHHGRKFGEIPPSSFWNIVFSWQADGRKHTIVRTTHGRRKHKKDFIKSRSLYIGVASAPVGPQVGNDGWFSSQQCLLCALWIFSFKPAEPHGMLVNGGSLLITFVACVTTLWTVHAVVTLRASLPVYCSPLCLSICLSVCLHKHWTRNKNLCHLFSLWTKPVLCL